MVAPTRPLSSLRRPSRALPGWRGVISLACSSVCLRWRRWKLRNASGFASSAIYRNERDCAAAGRRRFRFGLGRNSVSPSASSRPSRERSSSFRTGRPLSRSTARRSRGSRENRAGRLVLNSLRSPDERCQPAAAGPCDGGGLGTSVMPREGWLRPARRQPAPSRGVPGQPGRRRRR
jgi:hypothetical protein